MEAVLSFSTCTKNCRTISIHDVQIIYWVKLLCGECGF